MVLDIMPFEKNIKQIIWYLLKYQLLGKLAELISAFNDLKEYLITKRKTMHEETLSLTSFLSKYSGQLFSKLPRKLKNLFNKESFEIFCVFVFSFENVEITEENLKNIIGLNNKLESLRKNILEIRDNNYVPAFEKFLSSITVSCFTASGWQNALMWSHYANSYAGFCVEYDFDKMTNFIGFIKKIEYSNIRPTISLKDVGIGGIRTIENEDKTMSTEIVYTEPDCEKILKYVTVKDNCWKYEDEWRIINISKIPNTPQFIEMPEIKSITFGTNIDFLCKQLLWDVCKEKNIPCYELSLGHDDFTINRKQLTESDFGFNLDKESEYVTLIGDSCAKNVEKVVLNTSKATEMLNENKFDPLLFAELYRSVIDWLTDVYFIKASIIRIFANCEDIKNEETLKEYTNVVTELDNSVENYKKSIENLNETLINFTLNKRLSSQHCRQLFQLIFKINSLIEKINTLKWPNLIRA